MSSCIDLDAFLNHDLTAQRLTAFMQHADSCQACRRALETNSRIEGMIADWTQARGVAAPSPTAVARLVCKATTLRAPERRGWPRGSLTLGLGLGAVAVIIAVLSPGAKTFMKAAPLAGQSLIVFEPAGARRIEPAQVVGTVLETTGTLRARLGSDDLELAESARLEIVRADERATELRLDAGLLRLAVMPALPRSFTIDCGRCLVRVTGTRFAVRRGPLDCELVRVDEGRVQVALADRGEIEVHGGESLVIGAEGRPRLMGNEERSPAATAAEREGLVHRDGSADAAPARAPTKRAGAAAVQRAPQPAAFDLEQLRTWVTTGRYDDAERALRTHLAAFAHDVEAWSLLGDCQRKAGRFAPAVDAYRAVIAQGEPGSSNRARLLAAAVLQDRLADYRGAARLLEELLRTTATPALVPAAKLRLAHCYRALGEPARARKLLQEILDEAADAPEADEARRQLETWVTP